MCHIILDSAFLETPAYFSDVAMVKNGLLCNFPNVF